MKKIVGWMTAAALLGATSLNTKAGDREWATAGKVLAGGIAGLALFKALEPRPVVYQQPVTYVVANPPPVVVAQPTPVVYVQQPAVVYQQPVYVQPAPVVYAPAPVYYTPAPVVYYSAPVAVCPPRHFGFHHGHHWSRRGW